MSGDLIIQVLLGILVLVVGYTGYVSASRATRSQSASAGKAIDAAAYERARELYESAITTQGASLRAQITDLSAEVTRLRLQGVDLAAEVTALRALNTDLRQQIAVLKREAGGT